MWSVYCTRSDSALPLFRFSTSIPYGNRNVLADTLFYWSCQQPFYSGEVLDIISHLKRVEFGSTAHLDHVGVALFSTLLQCFTVGDLLSWQQRNDDEPDERYPITSQYPGYIRDVHKEMMKPDSVWAWPQLGAAAKFSWSILLRECSKIALFAGEEDYTWSQEASNTYVRSQEASSTYVRSQEASSTYAWSQ